MSLSNREIIEARWSGKLSQPGSQFDKTPNTPILIFESLALLGTALAFILLPRFTRQILVRFSIVGLAVLIFEMFTAPLWRNLHMGNWAYLYQQVSWILTLGWTSLILATVTFVDHFARPKTALQRFGVYIGVLTPIVFGFEIILHSIGLREYAPEVYESTCGVRLMGVPIETLYYAPVFLSLIIAFYKYWSLHLEQAAIIPVPHQPWLKTLGVSVLGVLLFELMIEPMVQNVGFPKWSYLYRDISFVMTGFWVLVLWVSINLTEKLLPHWNLLQRFLIYLLITAVIAIPVESWLIEHGHRIYGPSATANFSGLHLSNQVPLEVVFAIPLYFALVIGFIRYLDLAIRESVSARNHLSHNRRLRTSSSLISSNADTDSAKP